MSTKPVDLTVSQVRLLRGELETELSAIIQEKLEAFETETGQRVRQINLRTDWVVVDGGERILNVFLDCIVHL